MSPPDMGGASFVRRSLRSHAEHPASMIGAASMASSRCRNLALPGGTSQPPMVPAPLATIGSFAGEEH